MTKKEYLQERLGECIEESHLESIMGTEDVFEELEVTEQLLEDMKTVAVRAVEILFNHLDELSDKEFDCLLRTLKSLKPKKTES